MNEHRFKRGDRVWYRPTNGFAVVLAVGAVSAMIKFEGSDRHYWVRADHLAHAPQARSFYLASPIFMEVSE